MLLDQATDTQMRAAQIIGGATMVVVLAAPMFRHRAQAIRLVVTVVYIGVLVGTIFYFLL